MELDPQNEDLRRQIEQQGKKMEEQLTGCSRDVATLHTLHTKVLDGLMISDATSKEDGTDTAGKNSANAV
ncbi:isochorismatase hydrolase [Anopheles sinensis]|uniref:Isochorismatase hydrolase n=1 Tax=Anopheles sinensis TaxID=74873 RepID=A0A084VFT1_ANOSI|nr:isochorismatase hydrolase [Anopheles sinensis]